MALEAVVFPQDPFGYGCKDYLYSLVGATANYAFQAPEQEKVVLGIINNNNNNNNIQHHANWDSHSHSSPEPPSSSSAAATSTSRRKRRRTKSAKNKEEIENQRMTHIAVERNRRKQMNEYLAVLRSLMPSSYVQRGDQASIIGGAINFVKELEQLLQSMEGQKRRKEGQVQEDVGPNGSPFAEFFTFPQYTTRGTQLADIEVTMVDSHANIKILSKKQHAHLMKLVLGLQTLSLSILHLNVTTLHDTVLYSISVKVEEGCQLNTVDEIAGAVNQLLRTIQQLN
ncbi:transcription factor bHLH94 [Cajanus cajan]|uniref:Transcription factor bHLH94 n=1 Tax=Cajanus cajan TaxID=3821 RepID=A0A151RDA1_CAJCA|nr:transcription factor bHLH94 [Cajanus cajan]KYP40562.1 Transcription factor bHLH94 [Cajanus cajan]